MWRIESTPLPEKQPPFEAGGYTWEFAYETSRPRGPFMRFMDWLFGLHIVKD